MIAYEEDWSPEFAFKELVQKQVDKEDMLGWAKKQVPPVQEVRKVLVHKEKKLGHGFPLQILKYLP